MVLTNESIDLLRCKIVEQAAADYDWAINPKYEPKDKPQEPLTKKKWAKTPEQVRMERKECRKECEKFFRSEWYRMLVNIDGEAVIKEIKRRYEI